MIKYTEFYSGKLKIMIARDETSIIRTDLITPEIGRRFAIPAAWKQDDVLLEPERFQVLQYLSGSLTEFNLKLKPTGTEFQMNVWKQLLKIPRGQTKSYGDIAAALGKISASRAVGAAVGRNPIPLLIPCHRVIGANGSLTGFAHGLHLKRKLLELEGVEL